MQSAPTRDAGEIVVAFTRVLRGAGLNVPTSSTIVFGEAIACTGDRGPRHDILGRARHARSPARRPRSLRSCVRGLLGACPRRRSRHSEEEPIEITLAVDTGEEEDGSQPDSAEASDDPTIELRFSATEVLRHKDFADYSPDELVEAQQLMSRLRFAGSPRRLLRLGPTEVRTNIPDLRRTVKGGDARRRRADAPPLPHAHHPPATARAAARHQWFDGAVRAGTAAIRACRRRRPPEGRGLRTRHAADAGHPRVVVARSRRRVSPRRHTASSTTAEARDSATGSRSSTTNGASAAWHAARSSSSSPTVGIVANRRCSKSR